MGHPLRISLLRLGILISSGACLIAQQRAPTLDWSVVLGWLPVDTQTLIVATQPFVIPEDKDPKTSPTEVLHGFVLGRVHEFPVLYRALAGQTVKFALAGVRDFQSFSGLGLGPYDGCAVIMFAEPLADRLQTATSGLAKEDWSGSTVFFLSTVREGSLRAEPEQTNLFITQLAPNILVTATDTTSLRSLLERRAHPQTDRALDKGLPEWKEVEVTSKVWAMRHYKYTHQSQPEQSVPSLGPLEELDDSKAVGLVYNAQPNGPAQKLYYLSSHQQISEIARHHWEWKEEGLITPRVSRKSKGVAQVIIPTVSGDATSSFILLLLSSLGYEIAL